MAIRRKVGVFSAGSCVEPGCKIRPMYGRERCWSHSRPRRSRYRPCSHPGCEAMTMESREFCRHHGPGKGRWRSFPEVCSFPGCEEHPVYQRFRCAEHNGWRQRAAESWERPPKPKAAEAEWSWCTPCQRWVDDLLHEPTRPN